MIKQYNIKAFDVSPEAINWCKNKAKKLNLNTNNFFVMDALVNDYNEKFDFIYSVAVLHMLVEEDDRINFLKFIHNHLKDNGKAFIIVMGDGIEERKTDINIAFELGNRPFCNKMVEVANTSCRMVNWEKLLKELKTANFKIINKYIDKTVSGFNSSMVVEVEI